MKLKLHCMNGLAILLIGLSVSSVYMASVPPLEPIAFVVASELQLEPGTLQPTTDHQHIVTPEPTKPISPIPTPALPKAVLTRVDIGDASLLSTTGSGYDKFAWKVTPEEASVEPYFFRLMTSDGRPLGLSAYPKSCTVVFAAATSDPFQFDIALVELNKNHDPDPPIPPPPPPGLAGFVVKLVRELEIKSNTEDVGGFFKSAIPKINDNSLRGSKAIVESVTKRIAAMNSTKWQAFSTMLYQHLLNDLKLVTQTQWSGAYGQIVTGLESVK